MRFSFDWLKRHLKTEKTVTEIAEALTCLGLEVEDVIDADNVLRGFVLAVVSDVQKHPNADKLRTCIATLADGSTRHIVCGASNLRDGLKVVLALPGAVIPASGDVLKQSKIRGVPSEGMLCSLEELGMAKNSDGILEIPDHVSISSSVVDAVGYSSILDVSITPNRGDCFCVRGIARDLAAAGYGELIPLQEPNIVLEQLCDFKTDIFVDDVFGDMPFVAYRAIHGVKNRESPEWLQALLKSANVHSISAIIDFANFIMLDTGRPFHIYDLGKIKSAMQIKYAAPGQMFADLQRKYRKLSADTLIASCGADILCMLGIIGAEGCACTEDTTDVLIECALFSQSYISTVGNRCNISSDARTRFERGVDPESWSASLDELTEYVLKHCGGCASQVKTFGNLPTNCYDIEFTKNKLNSVAGCNVPFDVAERILVALGLEAVSRTENSIILRTPSYRYDLRIEEDLIEEVLRIFGYDNISCNELQVKFRKDDTMLDSIKAVTSIKRLACSCGLSELRSFPFISKDDYETFSNCNHDGVSILNPVSSELSIMRNSLFPNMLRNVSQSLKFSNRFCNLFEIGNVYCGNNFEEHSVLSCVRSGYSHERNWASDDRSVNIFDVKQDLFACLNLLGIDESKVSYDTVKVPKYYHPAKAAAVVYKKNVIGYFGEIRPDVCKKYDITTAVVACELFFDQLQERSKRQTGMYDKKLFQSVERDFSFVCNAQNIRDVHVNDIVAAVRKVSELIRDVYVFDYYKIDKTSVAIGVSITIRSNDATLNDEEIKSVCTKVIASVEKIGYGLR